MSEGKLGKIFIGVPGFAGIQPEAQESFIRMLFRCGRDLPQYNFLVHIVSKSEQFRARNRIVDAAMAADADYLLMLDDDMIVPHDLIHKLLAHDKDVVGALYWQRGGSFHPVLMRSMPLPEGGFHSSFYASNDPVICNPGLHEVDIIGGGCMFFKMDVFRKLMPPYFWWEHHLGTDIAICTRLREAGVKIYCDTSIELGHLRNEKEVITRDCIPLADQAMGAMKEELLQDVRAYFSLSLGEMESEAIKASQAELRRSYWHAEPRDTWEQVKKFYREHGEWHIKNLLYWAMARATSIDQWLMAGHLPERATILDLGPGIGAPTFHLASTHGYEVILADIRGAATMEFLKWRIRHRHLQASAVQLLEFDDPVPSTTFVNGVDCVVLESMLDHCWDAYATLEWALKQVKPGGYLLCDYVTGRKDAGKEDLEPQHLTTYDQFTIPQWLYERGFDESAKHPFLFQRRK